MMGFNLANLPSLRGGAMNWANSVAGPYKPPMMAPAAAAASAPAAAAPMGPGNSFLNYWNNPTGGFDFLQKMLGNPMMQSQFAKDQQSALMQGWMPGMGGFGTGDNGRGIGGAMGFGGYGYGQSGDIGGLAY